jgi:carboxypeptidase family protein
MKFDNSRAKIYVIFLVFQLCSSVLVVTPAVGGTLLGTVVGAASNPKPFVRVEVNGPQTSIQTFTNKDGQFSVDLSGGQYKIRVTEMNKSMQFTINVNQVGQTPYEFKLGW